MDQEMFQIGGADEAKYRPFRYKRTDYGKPLNAQSESDDKSFNTTQDCLNVSKIKLNHTIKLFLRVALILMIVYILANLSLVITSISESAAKIRNMGKSDFGNKEGLQWLGASRDVIRGDYENNVDSLAEKALKQQMAMTDMSAKATFVSRERLTTPEDELKKQFHTE